MINSVKARLVYIRAPNLVIPRTDVMGPLSLTWTSNYIHYKVWDEITDPFPNFNGATVEV